MSPSGIIVGRKTSGTEILIVEYPAVREPKRVYAFATNDDESVGWKSLLPLEIQVHPDTRNIRTPRRGTPDHKCLAWRRGAKSGCHPEKIADILCFTAVLLCFNEEFDGGPQMHRRAR